MKVTSPALLSLLLVAPLYSHATEQVIPAGSILQCTISEHRLSSKTTAVGDPVLCRTSHAERYGRSMLPYNSYLVGRFEDYKDPGHFVGKGWMELRFDHMVIEPNITLPISAKVVGVPGYNVDKNGRILGKGHEARDITMWSLPILWPIDLLMLPMRGPRPTLKEETRLMLKVMDDLQIPDTTPLQRDPNGLAQRPVAAYDPPPAIQAPVPAPEQQAYDPNQYQPAPEAYAPAPALAPAPEPVYAYAPPPPVYVYPSPAPAVQVYGYIGGGYGGGRGYAATRGYAPRGYYGSRGGYAPRAGYGYGGWQRGTAGGGYRGGGYASGGFRGGGGHGGGHR